MPAWVTSGVLRAPVKGLAEPLLRERYRTETLLETRV